MNLDFLKNLRLDNIFANFGGSFNQNPQSGFNPADFGIPQIGIGTPPINGGESGDMNGMSDIAKRMLQLYTPETQATDRFNNLLGEYPEQPNPSIWRKLGAIGLGTLSDFGRPGAGGPVFNKVMYGDHERKLADWKAQIGPSQQAADNERQTNVNERQMAYQTVTNELRAEAQEAKERNDLKRAQIAEQRANAYNFKAHNPNLRLIIQPSGNIMLMNPQSGEIEDTGIPSNVLSGADRLALQQQHDLNKIDLTNTNTKELQGIKHKDSMELLNKRIGGQLTVKSTAPGKTDTTVKPELPTQTRVKQFTKARELSNTRPDLRPFIKIGSPGSNDFTITPPGKSFFGGASGPTPEQYKEIQDFIYGNTQSTPPVTGSRNTPGPAANTSRSTNTGPGPNNAKRQQAIDILTANGKPVTEANITYIMNQIK